MRKLRNLASGFVVIILIMLSLSTVQAEAPSVTDVTISGGANIVTLTATAIDPDGFITKVEFFHNNNGTEWLRIGENTTKSENDYSREWNTNSVSDGNNFQIKAVATDNSSENGSATSSTFLIDNTLPAVTVTYPNGGETLSGNKNITATASDDGSGLKNVKFYFSSDNGGNWHLLTTETGPSPFSYEWDTTKVPNGDSHLIRAEATDNMSLKSSDESNSVFTIRNMPNNPPNVSVIWPNGGEVIKNGTITIQASAYDEDGTIEKVDFYWTVNSGTTKALINTVTSPATGTTYQVSWNTEAEEIVNGPNYQIYAIATDNESDTNYDMSNNTFTIANNHTPTLTDGKANVSSGITPLDVRFTITYKDIDNDLPVLRNIYIDGESHNMTPVDSKTPKEGKTYEYKTTLTATDSSKDYKYYFKFSDGINPDVRFPPSGESTVTVNPTTYETGNRIWDKTKAMNKEKYIWDAWSFSGFYYNLDDNIGGETLTIYDIDWTLDDEKVVYETEPVTVTFERSAFGNYNVIGFMAERYFAGYKSGTIGDSNDNLLDDDKLSKVLIDDDTTRMVRSGAGLTLEEGYEFRILELDIKGNNALVGLFKDDWKVEEDIVSGGDTFVHKEDGIPIIGIHINTVFAGMEVSSVRIDGVFQISDQFTEVDTGETFGLMRIDSVSSNKITMENRNSISLSRHKGESFNLMGKIDIEVGDSNDLRFAPVVDTTEPGTYELRGTVVTDEKDPEWTPLNFEGLLFDMDTGFGSETLTMKRSGVNDRDIGDGDLIYSTSPISISFEHKGDGWEKYQAIGFLGEKYFAGYLKGSSFISTDRSLIDEERLSRVLTDEDKKYTLRVGNPLTLQEGYSLEISDISRDGDLAMLSISKDGEEMASDIVGSGDTFVYEKEVGGTKIPIVLVHVDNIFTGFEVSSVFFDGIFQISESFTTVESSDSYGKMEVTSVNADKITLTNDDRFSLGRGETIDIMGDIKFKVADDGDEVRFYPFLEVVVEEQEFLELEIPDSVYQDEEFTIAVTSDGEEIEDATILFGDLEIGTTDSDGELTYTPDETGTFTITASKSGYKSVSEEIDVIFQPKVLEIAAPPVVDKGETFTISVTSEGFGIGGVSVKFGSKDLGTTPSSGNISYTPDEAGTFTISVSKTGYQDASRDIDITDPAARLVYTNLTIEPRRVQPDQQVNISVEAANFGTIRDADTITLKIDGKTVETREVILRPGESTLLKFTTSKSKPGTYRVEVDGRSGSFRVLGDTLGTTGVILLGIIVILFASAIIYSFAQGTLSFEIIAAKVQTLQHKIRQLFEK